MAFVVREELFPLRKSPTINRFDQKLILWAIVSQSRRGQTIFDKRFRFIINIYGVKLSFIANQIAQDVLLLIINSPFMNWIWFESNPFGESCGRWRYSKNNKGGSYTNTNDFLSISLSASMVFVDLVVLNFACPSFGRPFGDSFIPLGAKFYVICPLIQSVLFVVIVQACRLISLRLRCWAGECPVGRRFS